MMEYTNNNPLRVVTLCSGYDSQCMALERLKRDFPGFDYDCIAWAEIDRYAIQAHDAVFPQYRDRNMDDITSCDWSKITQPVDLLIYSTPCTSISNAGKQEGLKKGSGTASSIIWSVLNAIDVLKPKYLLMENVKALVSKKFMPDFREWYNELESRGYQNFWKVLNAKHYGIPQNRERVFMVSILDEDASFHFPEPFPLERRLKDILEEDVDERYYLSDKCVKGFMEHNRRHQEKGTGFLCRPKTGENIANALRANGAICPTDNMIYRPVIYDDYNGRVAEDQSVMGTVTPNCGTSAPRNGYKIIEPVIAASQGRNPQNSSDKTAGCPTEQRLEIGGDISNTITTVEKDNYVIEPFNTEKDGSAITITLHYSKTGIFNIMKGFGCGDTGIIRYGNIYGENMGSSMAGNVSDSEGISPSIMTCGGGNREPMIIQRGRGKNNGGEHELCQTITSSGFERNNLLTNGFHIRKLTEREAFRLMDVSEEDIDRIQAAGISRTQQYKMAGNSIVTNVLYHIFRKMFVDTECEGEELTLF